MWGLKRTSRWLWLSATLIVVFLGSGNPRTALAGQSPEPVATPPQIALQKVHMIETREGSKLWEIQADQVDVHEREGVTVLTRVTQPIHIAFFSNQGQVTCVANRATLDLKTKDVRLQGAVWAQSDQGMELRTEALTWTAGSRRLHTDQAVTIKRGTLVSQGRGMEAETGLERVRIFQNITSQFGSARIPTGRSRSR
jgi:LPS export ABC transporter protein LptC